MPISPLTKLSLTAEVNVNRLRDTFRVLENEHGFYVDPGAWCCRSCAVADAWDDGRDMPFVFWHEQDEEGLGVASESEGTFLVLWILNRRDQA